ncbi:MAG: helix-turn-helix transcriptional regulator [Clostridia bacterium]|nr:helix-turn-helix transcriptional regulator [Clostridia bacterium]
MIRELRLERGLTQPQLATLVGVSKGMISIWENNVNEPKASYIKRLAIVLEVSSDYLLGIEK